MYLVFFDQFLHIAIIGALIVILLMIFDSRILHSRIYWSIVSKSECDYIVPPKYKIIPIENGYGIQDADGYFLSGQMPFCGYNWYGPTIDEPTVFKTECLAKGALKCIAGEYHEEKEIVKTSGEIKIEKPSPTIDSACDYKMPEDWTVVRIDGKFGVKIKQWDRLIYLIRIGGIVGTENTVYRPSLFDTKCQAKAFAKEYHYQDFEPKFKEDPAN